MSLVDTLSALVARLLPFAPEVEEFVQLLESGADKQAIMTAARTAAAAASDEAAREADGLGP